MPARHQRLQDARGELAAALAAIRADLDLPEAFPADVEAAAERAAAETPLPDADRTSIPFVTIDPEGSTDLDQALHIERDGDGFVVHYAIADVPSFVEPGRPIDAEARRRGQTLYAPDTRIPLHPVAISEGAASLLPEQDRPALVWRFRLDASGEVVETGLERARVRSREQLTYAQAQERADAGDALMGLLREVGELRIALEDARDGASLDLPEEQVVERPEGWRIERRELLPVERWNAQLSLMTGMAAARIQLEAGVGILRTMPTPPRGDVRRFRKEVAAIGEAWRDDEHYGAFLRRLDRAQPTTLAILTAARRLFRGAGYTIVTPDTKPGEVEQAAIGAPYAHATAPLRRLVDRYVLAICEAVVNGREAPEWAVAGLEGLPEIMAESSRTAAQLERESIDAVEIAVLQHRVGEEFDAVVVERREQGATILLLDPPAEAGADASAEPGERIRVRLTEADLASRRLRFAQA